MPERYAGRVTVGGSIAFRVAGNDRRFEGRIYALDPHIDSTTRTLTIRAVTSNAGGELFPGAFASVELMLDRTEGALMIPAVALVPELESPYVFVIVDGKAEQRRIVTGVRTENRVQVLSGLRAGDIVITTGLQQLRAGADVDATVANNATSAAARDATIARDAAATPAVPTSGALAGDLAGAPAVRR